MKEPVILHIVSSLPTVGGTSAKIYKLIEKSKFIHHVFYPETNNDDIYLDKWKSLPNCKLIKSQPSNHYLKNIIILNKYIKDNNISIIHVYFPPGTIVASIVKLFNPKIIIIRSFEGNVKHGIIKKNLLKIFLLNFNKLIYISNYVKSFYQDKIPYNQKNNGVIIYNSATQEKEITGSLFHDIRKCKLVTVSGLNPNKNLFILIDIVKELKNKYPNIILEIIGDGELRHKIEEKIKINNLNNNIKLLGYKLNVINYLDNSSIYIHPADNEGFGIAVIEAMLRFCPIIVSDKGGLPEIIDNNIDGLISNAYDVKEWCYNIEKILENQELATKLGYNAYKKAISKFSSEKYVVNHENLYLELINSAENN